MVPVTVRTLFSIHVVDYMCLTYRIEHEGGVLLGFSKSGAGDDLLQSRNESKKRNRKAGAKGDKVEKDEERKEQEDDDRENEDR